MSLPENSFLKRFSSTIFPAVTGELKFHLGIRPKNYSETVNLRWGDGFLELKIPSGWRVHYPTAAGAALSKKDECEIIRNALANPTGSLGLRDKSLSGKRVLIITDDNTRPTPVARFLSIILDELAMAGAENILLMPALGIHSAMSEKEIERKAGIENIKRIKWKNHDAFDSAQTRYFGTTSRGTAVELNREIGMADLIVLLGTVEPHMWAGFGGGLKNILPGMASAKCIGAHHAIIAEPPYRYCRIGMMAQDNSFRLDLEEVRPMIRSEIFCLNVILNIEGQIIGAAAGDPVSAHRSGIEASSRITGRHFSRRMNGVIANSYPMDTNFKQSMKGVGNSLGCLNPGGVIMGFLRAEKGLDDIKISDRTMWLPLLKLILRTIGPSGILRALDKNRPGMNPEEKFLAYYSLQLITNHEVYLYVPSMSDDDFRKIALYRRYNSPQETIDRAWASLGDNADIAVLEDAGATYPVIE
jgi:lactate racemase